MISFIVFMVCPVVMAASWYILYKKEVQVESEEDDDEDDYFLPK